MNLNWNEAEQVLDGTAALKALPINGRRTEKSYLSGYETPGGRHLVLERRGASAVAKVFVELPFDETALALSADSSVKHYGADEKRIDIGRASLKLALGKAMVCVKLGSTSDLKKLVDAELRK